MSVELIVALGALVVSAVSVALAARWKAEAFRYRDRAVSYRIEMDKAARAAIRYQQGPVGEHLGDANGLCVICGEPAIHATSCAQATNTADAIHEAASDMEDRLFRASRRGTP